MRETTNAFYNCVIMVIIGDLYRLSFSYSFTIMRGYEKKKIDYAVEFYRILAYATTVTTLYSCAIFCNFFLIHCQYLFYNFNLCVPVSPYAY